MLTWIVTRPEVAEKVLDVAGSIYQGYTTEEEAHSVWERAQLRAAAAGNASTGAGAERRRRTGAHTSNGASARANDPNPNGTRSRTRAHTGAGAGGAQIHSGSPPSNTPNVNYSGDGDTRNGSRTHTYPSPEPSAQGTQRGGTSTLNHQHHSRCRSISISSELEGSESAHPRVTVDTSISNESRDWTRARASPSNSRSQTTLRGTPTTGDQRSHPRTRSSGIRPSELEQSLSGPRGPHVSVGTSNGNRRTRTRAYPSASVHTYVSGDTSFVTARSERTSSWVAETSAILPSVPESISVLRTTQTRINGASDEPRRVSQLATASAMNATIRSPLALSLRATVDTSYAISISSSSTSSNSGVDQMGILSRNSKSSRSPRTTASPSSNPRIPVQGATELWVERGSPQDSSYETPSSSPRTEVTQIEAANPNSPRTSASKVLDSNSRRPGKSSSSDRVNFASQVPKVESLKSGPPQRAALSRAASVPQLASVRADSSLHRKAVSSPSLSLSPVEVTRVASGTSGPRGAVGLPSSPRVCPPRTPSHPSRTTVRARHQAQSNSAVPRNGSIYPDLICRCKGICSSCHLLRQAPMPRSSAMNTIGFSEPPHVANVVYDAQADPRSPIRRGGTGVPAQPGR